MIAVLYADRGGPYPKMDVDVWDEARDARLYPGPGPVVAHPPCGPWGSLKHMRVPNRKRRAAEADCMAPAIAAVQRWGGILEQPAGSAAFEAFGLPLPFCDHFERKKTCRARKRTPPGGCNMDRFGGFTIEVTQVEWGHIARKRTWLYIVGVPRAALEAPPYPGRAPTHWVSGGRLHDRKGSGGIVPPGIKVCSAQQRRRTPPEFAAYLVRLARAAEAARRAV